MNNAVVRQFLEGFFLISRVDSKTFKQERSSLFSPCVATFILNSQGVFEYHGIDDSIAGLYECFKHFHIKEPYCLEFLVETPTRAYVKLDVDIDFTDRAGGVVRSTAGQHYWSVFFEVEGQCIIRLELRFQRERTTSRENQSHTASRSSNRQ